MAANSIPPDRKNVPVHLTADFRADLAVLMANGARASDVIRAAVHHAANAYRRAHDYGDVPEGTDPVITGCTYRGEARPQPQLRAVTNP
ncbi:hypothetical protein [Streptomyces sp. NPDC020983]|uniref:hypothetical protein n=1 Tax=Streptomyces sp. NPDC020983 TaxID=3365106 RepID=UPI0037B23884